MPEENVISISPREVTKADEYRQRKETSVLAIVFGDVIDSSRHLETLGDDRYLDRLDQQLSLIRSAVERNEDGKILEVQGDGFRSGGEAHPWRRASNLREH
jgi:class 3 adenylate cyclase